MAGHYVFSVRTETGELRRYGFRADTKTSAYLDKLPNRSEFIRHAVEREIVLQSGGASAGALPGEVTARLSRLEEAVQKILNMLSSLHMPPRSDVHDASSHGDNVPVVRDPLGSVGGDEPEDDGRPSPEELAKMRELMFDFGQPKGGDKA